MNITRNRPLRVAASLLASALLVGACGSADKSAGTDQAKTTKPSDSAAGSERFVLPTVDVLDVATGNKVPFGQLSPSEKPLLLWFWAPH